MRIWLEINRAGGRIERRKVKGGEVVGTSEGACPNPECGAEPFYVKGSNRQAMNDDRTYRADGHCAKCGDPVGYIFAKTDTIFGLEEDERVGLRCRVY